MSPVQVCINSCLKLALGLAEIFPLIRTSWVTAPGDPLCTAQGREEHRDLFTPAEEEEVSGPRVLSSWLVQSPHVLCPRKVSTMRRSTIPPQRTDNTCVSFKIFALKKDRELKRSVMEGCGPRKAASQTGKDTRVGVGMCGSWCCCSCGSCCSAHCHLSEPQDL